MCRDSQKAGVGSLWPKSPLSSVDAESCAHCWRNPAHSIDREGPDYAVQQLKKSSHLVWSPSILRTSRLSKEFSDTLQTSLISSWVYHSSCVVHESNCFLVFCLETQGLNFILISVSPIVRNDNATRTLSLLFRCLWETMFTVMVSGPFRRWVHAKCIRMPKEYYTLWFQTK